MAMSWSMSTARVPCWFYKCNKEVNSFCTTTMHFLPKLCKNKVLRVCVCGIRIVVLLDPKGNCMQITHPFYPLSLFTHIYTAQYINISSTAHPPFPSFYTLFDLGFYTLFDF